MESSRDLYGCCRRCEHRDIRLFEPQGIPLESESSQHEREEQKFVPYQVASEIPRKIRQQRNNAAKLGATEVAHKVLDELLIQWLLVLPWRQRNIRECRND